MGVVCPGVLGRLPAVLIVVSVKFDMAVVWEVTRSEKGMPGS